MNLTWTVSNTGSVDTLASQWYDRIILSTDATYGNADDVYVGQFLHNGAVASGAGYTGSGTVTMPTGLHGGSSLFVVTDIYNHVAEFPNESNNVSAPIALGLTAPDLVVDAVTAPATGQFGQSLDVSWTVRNLGDASTQANWSDRIWLSADTVLDGGDTLLLTVAAGALAPLAPGASYTNTASAPLPLSYSLSGGNYYLLVQADALTTVPEINESNNVGASQAPRWPSACRRCPIW